MQTVNGLVNGFMPNPLRSCPVPCDDDQCEMPDTDRTSTRLSRPWILYLHQQAGGDVAWLVVWFYVEPFRNI